jgi:hypothetical protein
MAAQAARLRRSSESSSTGGGGVVEAEDDDDEDDETAIEDEDDFEEEITASRWDAMCAAATRMARSLRSFGDSPCVRRTWVGWQCSLAKNTTRRLMMKGGYVVVG